MPKVSVSSSITNHVLSLCLHLSSLNLCHLISIVDVILFGLDFLSISNPVFRWESCKGSEWESVKKCSRLCKDAETRGWTRRWLATGKPPKLAHVWSMRESWRVMPAVALQDKSPRLARPLAHGLNSRLSPVARPSCQTTLFGKT